MIGVFFGGSSCEHEVSVLTGLTMYGFLKGPKRAIYLDREGRWWSGRGPESLKWFQRGRPSKEAEEVTMLPGSPVLYRRKGRLKPLGTLSCALICCHGRQGEDGCLQGLFELCTLPYTSAGVGASAIGMDKALTKQVLSGKIPQLPFQVLRAEEFRRGKWRPASDFPLIVKPARLGSSVGIGVAGDQAELYAALTEAFRYDEKAVIEPCLEDFEEYNCSAFLCGGKVMVSGLEQPVRSREILTYADKYQKGCYKAGRQASPSDPGLVSRIRELTAEIYRLLELSGVVRADFLVKGKEIYFNEVNTVPGSLAYYFWEKEGIPPTKLLSLLTEEAMDRAKAGKELRRRFDTDILETAGLNSCKK